MRTVLVAAVTVGLAMGAEVAWSQASQCPDPYETFGKKLWERTQKVGDGTDTRGDEVRSYHAVFCRYENGVRVVLPDGSSPPGIIDVPEATLPNTNGSRSRGHLGALTPTTLATP